MYSYQYPHPAVTADSVIFSIRDERLNVLLIERGQDPHRGRWAFPGGFLDIDEELAACVRRELEEETGLTNIALEQFYTFGRPGRDPRERVITVAYLAFIQSDSLQLHAADDAADARWFDLDDLPPLAFDHDQVLGVAHERLVEKVLSTDLARCFLPEAFTCDELRDVYVIACQERLDASSLKHRLLTSGLIECVSNDPAEERFRFRAAASTAFKQ